MKLLRLILLMGVSLMANAQLKVGDKAPEFSLKDETNKVRSLSEFNKDKVVIFFYPKDGSPNCTKEACSLRDANTIYKKHGVVVLGISYDSPESHLKFKQEHHLPFPLLSDTNKKVAKMYGLGSGWFGKRILNHFYPERVTFLIDQGNIVQIIKNINVNTQAHDILKAFGIEE